MSKENALFPQVKEAITFDVLWQQVTDTIASLSSTVWTDTGEHDPGITLLQAVTWNCSDLSYRASLPLNDLLTSQQDPNLFPEEFGPQGVLTCNTITAEDYRRVLRDLHSSDITDPPLDSQQTGFLIQDACLIKEPTENRFSWWYDPEKRQYTFIRPENSENAKQIIFRGNDWLYVLPDRFTLGLSAADRQKTENYLSQCLTDHRNLGESVSRIIWLQPVNFSPKFTIELATDISDPSQVVAEIYQTIEKMLLPAVTRLSTADMQRAGYPAEDIFVGPNLQHGWQPDQPPLISDKGITLNLSQMFNRLLEIPGIENISQFSTGTLPPEITTVENETWSLQVAPGYYPLLWDKDPLTELVSDKSPLTLIAKGGIYTRPDRDQVAAHISSPELIQTPAEVLPSGKLRDLSAYTAVSQRLPECYQLQSPDEVISDAVRELHQFILAADQQLADSAAELAALPQLLAFRDRKKNNIIRGTRWPYATDSVSQQVHQQYAEALINFQQQNAAIFTADDQLNPQNYARELDFLQYLLGYFGTTRADIPLTLDLADFLSLQRAFLAQQPSLGYDRINIRIDQVSALQKRIAARIGLNSECFADNPDTGKLPFYLIEHRQLLPLMPDISYNSRQTPDAFTVATSLVTLTQKGSAGKLARGQLVELIALEGDSELIVGPLLIVATSGDSFTLNKDDSQQLQNDLDRLQTAWQNKKLYWQNSNTWLQDMDYRLNYASADIQPAGNNRCLLASNDQSPYPTMIAIDDQIVIRPASLAQTRQDTEALSGNPGRQNSSWQLEAKIIALDKVAGTILIEKMANSAQDFPPADEAWRYRWNFTEAHYATTDRFSFVVSIVHNRNLVENSNIDAPHLIEWLQRIIMAEFPAHVSLINHWLSQSAFKNFASTYKRWQNNGSPLGDDAFAIMEMLTLGRLPTASLNIGLMRIATEDQHNQVMGNDGTEWHSEIILSEELFYVPNDLGLV